MKGMMTTGWMTIAMAASFFFLVFSQGAVALAFEEENRVKCLVELDRSVLPAGMSQRAVVKITLSADHRPSIARRAPVNLALVLDRSGSMSGSKIEKAKEAAIEAVRRLDQGDIFSLVIYDHVVETLVPSQYLNDTRQIENRIRSVSARGNTALFGGVSRGAAEIRKHPFNEYVRRIILLSDGLANVGPSAPEALGRLGAALIKENISVTTVGLGTGYNEDLMTRLAQNSDGNMYFVESSRDLPQIFSAELGEVMNVVAKKVFLTIRCEDGIRPIGLIGREGRILGQTVELSMNQLYAGQDKYALLEIEIPPTAPNRFRKIASAHVQFEDAFTLARYDVSDTASARFSINRRDVEASSNVAVQREYRLNLDAIAKDKAINLADTGKKKAAADVLRESSKELRAAGEKFNDEVLIQKAEEAEEKAATIENEGMTNRSRKALRTESYQLRYQQTER